LATIPTPSLRPQVRTGPLGPDDLGAVASLHLEAFHDSELTRLGHEAVRRSYQWQFDGPHDLVALGAWVGEDLVGFLFGGVFRGSTIGFIKRERWFLLGQVLRHPSMVVNRRSLSRIGLAVRLLGRRGSPAQSEDPAAVPPRSFGILAIAVSPAAQGAGVGQTLIGLAEEEARRQGFPRMHLTVHPDNERAVRFYTDGGWERNVREGVEWSGQMIKTLVP
jgi:ribosomal protein S18 acetylase RimI-like enzyme